MLEALTVPSFIKQSIKDVLGRGYETSKCLIIRTVHVYASSESSTRERASVPFALINPIIDPEILLNEALVSQNYARALSLFSYIVPSQTSRLTRTPRCPNRSSEKFRLSFCVATPSRSGMGGGGMLQWTSPQAKGIFCAQFHTQNPLNTRGFVHWNQPVWHMGKLGTYTIIRNVLQTQLHKLPT